MRSYLIGHYAAALPGRFHPQGVYGSRPFHH